MAEGEQEFEIEPLLKRVRRDHRLDAYPDPHILLGMRDDIFGEFLSFLSYYDVMRLYRSNPLLAQRIRHTISYWERFLKRNSLVIPYSLSQVADWIHTNVDRNMIIDYHKLGIAVLMQWTSYLDYDAELPYEEELTFGKQGTGKWPPILMRSGSVAGELATFAIEAPGEYDETTGFHYFPSTDFAIDMALDTYLNDLHRRGIINIFYGDSEPVYKEFSIVGDVPMGEAYLIYLLLSNQYTVDYQYSNDFREFFQKLRCSVCNVPWQTASYRCENEGCSYMICEQCMQ